MPSKNRWPPRIKRRRRRPPCLWALWKCRLHRRGQSPLCATQVELHRADGTRLCIHSAESTLPLEALVRAFLEVR